MRTRSGRAPRPITLAGIRLKTGNRFSSLSAKGRLTSLLAAAA
jgi:hypothetical protein